MGEVGDGSLSSPQVEHLDLTGNDDGSMGVDLSDLQNPVNVFASVDCVARHCSNKNKELQVKVSLECFNFIQPLHQMGYTRIEHAESTYIVLSKDKSLHNASGVTLMQRENISSSSKPCNQTPDVILAVQTPLETPCAQGPEFQQSTGAFSLGPPGMGNDNEAVGFQGFSTGFEIPVQKKRPHSANKSKRPSTRPRGPDYGDQAKGLLLQFRLEYNQDPANEGKPHKWLMPVTEKMQKNGYDREPDSLRRLWETTQKNRNALRRAFPEGSTAYWDLTMVEKKALKKIDRDFPLTFEPEWVADMKKIEEMDPRSVAKNETQSDGQERVLQASAITGLANFAGASSSNANIQASVQHFEQANAQGSDKDLLENPHRPPAPPSCTQDLSLSFWHSQREKDNQAIFATTEEQVTELKKFLESSDSLGLVGDADFLKFFA